LETQGLEGKEGREKGMRRGVVEKRGE